MFIVLRMLKTLKLLFFIYLCMEPLKCDHSVGQTGLRPPNPFHSRPRVLPPQNLGRQSQKCSQHNLLTAWRKKTLNKIYFVKYNDMSHLEYID